jgi:hypothetical protein
MTNKHIITLKHTGTGSQLSTSEFGIAFRLARFGFTGHCKCRQTPNKLNIIEIDHQVTKDEVQAIINEQLNPEVIELQVETTNTII